MLYLDYNASTPLADEVREAMLPFLRAASMGNPSSGHLAGRPLRKAIENAREKVAELLGASPDEIVFTSGGTEGCNLVIQGVAHALKERGRHIILSSVEHYAVTHTCKYLEREGFEISYVPVDSTGRVDPQDVAGEVRPTSILIAILHAQNEVGTIQPIAEIADIAREGGVLMFTDAAQSCGKISTRVDELGVDFLTIAGHKFYGPQGIGAAYVRRGVRIEPLHHGAGHQRGVRSGTEPVALIAGLGAAAHLALHDPATPRLARLRDRLFDGLQRELAEEVALLGHPSERLPNTLCVGFRNRIGSDILAGCPDLCASTGAACHSGRRQRSATLAAMNVPEELAFGAVRLSVGRCTTESEIDRAAGNLAAAAKALPATAQP